MAKQSQRRGILMYYDYFEGYEYYIESKNNALNSVVYEAKDVIYKLRTQWRLDNER